MIFKNVTMIATNRTNHLLILTKARQPKYTLLPSNVCTSSTKLACRDAKSSVCKYVVLSSAMLLDEAELTEQTRCVSTPSKSPQQAAYWLKGSRTCLQTSDTSRSSFIACCCDVLSKQFCSICYTKRTYTFRIEKAINFFWRILPR